MRGNPAGFPLILPEQVALGSVLVGAALVAGKLVVGLLTGSLGILSEAVHSLLDLVASAFTLVAVRTAKKPADEEHPYGHGRAENLAAFTEGVLLLITAAGIAYEAVRRLAIHDVSVNPATYAFVLLLVTMAIESVRAYVLSRVGRAANSEALAADATNRFSDVLSTIGVLAGLVGVRMGYAWADSLAALLVAGIIARAAIGIAWHSGDILIDRAPAGAEDQLRMAIGGVDGVREVRSVRIRRSGAEMFGDARIATSRMLPLEGARSLVEEVRQVARTILPTLDLTVLVEGQERDSDLVERVHAAGARDGGVRDLHNVTVEREADGSLHLTMHAKLPSDITLAQASSMSREFEKTLRRDLPDVSRVDIHLEPLEPELVRGKDVTQRRAELVARMRSVVEAHPEVRRCLDVELSERHHRIYAHVVAELLGSVVLDHAHQVETELEERIRRAAPEVHEVVARAIA